MPDAGPSSPVPGSVVSPDKPGTRMSVVSSGPLPTASCVWQPRPGSFTFTVVCKATFTLGPGLLALASEQEPVHADDRPWGNGLSSLYAAADLGPSKPRADVVLVGKAYAPGRVPARSLVARLSVAQVDKSVHVWCDRTYAPDGTLQEGPPFLELPLVYERTAGGPGTGNPVGMAAAGDGTGAVALPNLTIPFAPAVPGGMPMTAAGFGPLGALWPSRRARLGRHAEAWSPDSWRLAPLPADLDAAYFNVAPEDQQTDVLVGNERVLLENLHPDIPQLHMVLPGLVLRARLESAKGPEAVRLVCDTLWIDTERRIGTLSYRGHVPLASAADEGCVTVTVDVPARAAAAARPSGIQGRPSAPALEASVERRSEPPPSAWDQALPFRSTTASERPPGPSAPPFVTAPKLEPVVPQLHRSPWAPPVANQHVAPGAQPSTPTAAMASPLAQGDARPPAIEPPANGRSSRPTASFSAAFGGPKAASDSPAAPPNGAVSEPAREAASRQPSGGRQLVVNLLCHDSAIVPRVRKAKRFAAALVSKSRERRPQGLDEPQKEPPPDERRDMLRLLSYGPPADADEIRRALDERLEESDDLDLPLLLVEGELRPTFDETEVLKATIAIAQTVAKGDKKVLAAIALGQEAVAAPVALRPETSLRIARQIEQSTESLSLPPRYVAVEAERVVLEGRKYKQRTILGASRLRADLMVPRGSDPWPLYLPESVAAALPLMIAFPVVALCEVTAREDMAEAQPQALVAAALGRVLLSRHKELR